MTGFALQTMTQVAVERVLNTLPEGVLIAFFAWALLHVLRRQNSGTRFAVWFVALLTVAALPIVCGLPGGRMLVSPRMSWGLGSAVTSAMSGSAAESLRAAINLPAQWEIFVFLAWAVGAGVAILRLGVGLWHLRQLSRSCSAIDAATLDTGVRETIEMIAKSGVRIVASERVRVPAAIGLAMRTIVLPAWTLRELPAQDLSVILLHEFIHLRRRDDWTNLVQKLVRAILFFHPAVWWIESRLSVEREMACDDAVLAKTANPHGYATCLVSLLEKSLLHRRAQPRWAMAQAAVNRAHEAAARLAQILDAKRPVATHVWKPALGMVGAFSLLCLMALPQAPKLVAFDRGDALGSLHGAGSSALATGMIPAAVVPVSLRTHESPLPDASQPRTRSRLAIAGTARTHFIAPPQAARAGNDAGRLAEGLKLSLAAAPGGKEGVALRARAGERVVPEFHTLVFVEATAYGNPDSRLWSVQVWQVTFVSAVGERLTRGPMANSI